MKEFKKITIQPLLETSIDPFEIKVSQQLLDFYRIKAHQPITLQCGQKKVTVSATPIKEKEMIFYCSYRLLDELYLPNKEQTLCLFLDTHSYTLYLGPIIATVIQMKKGNLENHLLRPFLEELSKYSETIHALFYVFSVTDWNEECVDGYVFQNNAWKKEKVPHPSVIYNRIHSRNYEQSKTLQQFFSSLHDANIPYFNDHFLNKWEVHQTLSTFEYLAPYLPETMLMNGLGTLTDLKERHSTIFIKPIHGSLGRDIYRIQQREEEDWTIDYSSFNGEVGQSFSSLHSLYQSLRERLRKKRFLCQQGLELITFENRPVDFRVLCVRDVNGEWKVVSSVARVSNKDTFVSNLAKGGEIYKISEILKEHFSAPVAYQIQKAVIELAIECVNIITQETEGLYGELGVDLAVDNSGHPWIIEINTKPSKNLDKKTTKKVRPSSKAIIKFGFYLSLRD